MILLSLAMVRNSHYVISAQVPWSIWTALALVRLGQRLHKRGWSVRRLQLMTQYGFISLALAYGAGFWLGGLWFDHRGREWAFYETVNSLLPPGTPLALLYDDWDRDPYPSPFGAIPHDLAVRLFYLGRPACWHYGSESLACHKHTVGMEVNRVWSAKSQHQPNIAQAMDGVRGGISAHAGASAFGVIARKRDLGELSRIGQVEIVAHGPQARHDRIYVLLCVRPEWKASGQSTHTSGQIERNQLSIPDTGFTLRETVR
jgi:hypothetical protein